MQLSLLVSIIFSLLSLLLGGGVGLALLRKLKADAVREYQHEEMKATLAKNREDINQLQTALTLHQQRLDQVVEKLAKLDLLDVVHANVQNLMRMADNMIPRPEAEAKISGLEHRVENIEVVLQKEAH